MQAPGQGTRPARDRHRCCRPRALTRRKLDSHRQPPGPLSMSSVGIQWPNGHGDRDEKRSTFNVQRSTFNAQRSTFIWSGSWEGLLAAVRDGEILLSAWINGRMARRRIDHEEDRFFSYCLGGGRFGVRRLVSRPEPHAQPELRAIAGARRWIDPFRRHRSRRAR